MRPAGSRTAREPGPVPRTRTGLLLVAVAASMAGAPSGVAAQQPCARVPNVEGESYRAAVAALATCRLRADSLARPTQSRPAGIVVRQEPGPEEPVPPGRVVRLHVTVPVTPLGPTRGVDQVVGLEPPPGDTVSGDRPDDVGDPAPPSDELAPDVGFDPNVPPVRSVEVPNLVGMTLPAATAALGEWGLVPGVVDSVLSERPRGTVVEHAPGQRASVEPGTPIDLWLAASTPVPPAPESSTPATEPAGEPVAGPPASPGVDPEVGAGTPESPVEAAAPVVVAPDLTDLTLAEAATAVRETGLDVAVAPGVEWADTTGGRVGSQDPAPGDSLTRGATILVRPKRSVPWVAILLGLTVVAVATGTLRRPFFPQVSVRAVEGGPLPDPRRKEEGKGVDTEVRLRLDGGTLEARVRRSEEHPGEKGGDADR